MSADLRPFAAYDTKKCAVAYIGLHMEEADVWQVFLGWPSAQEIRAAKERGMCVIPVTLQYKPPNQ